VRRSSPMQDLWERQGRANAVTEVPKSRHYLLQCNVHENSGRPLSPTSVDHICLRLRCLHEEGQKRVRSILGALSGAGESPKRCERQGESFLLIHAELIKLRDSGGLS
jgi:hypothetical protein